jgi:sarcosine oxidase subunit beta
VRELEPLVSTEIAGGIYGPHDGVVNPIKLAMNLARLAKRNSARFLLHTTANRILKDDNGINGVETSQGVVRTDKVVVAAGTGMPGLIQPLGLNIPLDYVRGEILVTAPIKPIINYPSRHVLQTVEGNLLLGSTHDRDGLERITTIESAQKITTNAILSFPILEELPVIRQYAGIRPMPRDGKPYLGPVEQIPGLYLAVSHSGITLSPIYGKIISDLIIMGQTDLPINLYCPERYTESEVKIERPEYT